MLYDYAQSKFSDWAIHDILVAQIGLKLDAIYAYDSKRAKSNLLNISQIIQDFRLFSDFIQKHQKSKEDQPLFYFVEAYQNFEDVNSQTKLCFNNTWAYNYTHVLVGANQDHRYRWQELLTLMDKYERKDLEEYQVQKTIVIVGK